MEPIYVPSWWDIHNDRLTHASTQQSFFTHGSGRALFLDCGRLGNVYANTEKEYGRQKEKLKLTFQFEESVRNVYYSIPYYCEDDVKVSDLNSELNPHLFIANREATLNKYRHLRKIANKGMKEKTKNKCRSYISSVRKVSSVKKLTKKALDSVPISVIYASEKYMDLLSTSKYTESCKTNSSMYSGGCIKMFTLEGEIFIARCVGVNLGSLRIDRYDGSLKQVYPSNDTLIYDENISIFEIDCLILLNECRLLLRRMNTLQLYIIKSENDGLSVVNMGFIPSGLTSTWLCGRLNHWCTDELMATTSDEVILYDIETMNSEWRLKTPCLSSVIDSWCEVKPLLPMQWIRATRSECCLVDCRRNAFDSTSELLSFTHPTLNQRENFSHLSTIFDTHYVHLFSSYSGHLLDIRFPGRQVSQWAVPMLNPVSYSSSFEIESEMQCVIGVQMNARHCIFDMSLSSKCKSTALASQDIVEESPMSLGLTTLQDYPDVGITTVLTLDHRGKVICHQYSRASSKGIRPYSDIDNFIGQEPNKVKFIYDYMDSSKRIKDHIDNNYSQEDINSDVSNMDVIYNKTKEEKKYKNEDVFNI